MIPYRATRLGADYDAITGLPVSVLLHDVRSAYNVGAFFRTIDGVGGHQVYVSGITPAPTHRGVAKTALGAESTVPWTRVDSPDELLTALQLDGTTVAAVETSLHAVDLFDWQPAFPVCLLFGHEVTGIDDALARKATVHVRIPMLGRKHSLNVATAGGVVLYELLRKYRVAARP